MRNTVDVFDIIRGIVARKRAARREPVFALWREIWQEHVSGGGTGSVNEQIDDLVEWGLVTEHRTVTDKAYMLVEDENGTEDMNQNSKTYEY